MFAHVVFSYSQFNLVAISEHIIHISPKFNKGHTTNLIIRPRHDAITSIAEADASLHEPTRAATLSFSEPPTARRYSISAIF